MILSDIVVLKNNANYKGPILNINNDLFNFIPRGPGTCHRTVSGYHVEYRLSNKLGESLRVLTKTYYK